MRLTCPNCRAHYEVDEALIPENGREVQCSACDATWTVPDRPDPGETATGDVRPATRSATMSDPESPAGELPGEAIPRRREIDPRVREILRGEAEREAAARNGEAGRPGTPEAARRDETPGTAPQPPAPAPAAPPPRGDAPPATVEDDRSNALLPDTAEINSTLMPVTERPDPPAEPAPHTAKKPRRVGAAWGFWGALMVVALLVVLYVAAASVPALGPALGGYVATVDALRDAVATFAARLGG